MTRTAAAMREVKQGQVLHDLQTVYGYMVVNGQFTNGEFDSMGGWQDQRCYSREEQYEYYSKYKKFPDDKDDSKFVGLKDITLDNIDWDLVTWPEFLVRSEFVGTDCENESVDVLRGKIYLKDGRSVYIGVREPHDVVLDLIESYTTTTKLFDLQGQAKDFWNKQAGSQ